MARSRSDDYDDRYDDRPAPFPGIVMAAGVIWICYGALSIIGTVVTLAMPQGNQGEAPGTCCGGLIGLAFLVVGHQTVTGRAKDTRGNGVGSFVLGLIALVGAAAIGLGGAMQGQNPNQPAPPEEEQLVIAGTVAAFGCTLILAGILALAGRDAYRAWRAEDAPQRRRRERRREENENRDERDGRDEDDRPWKRRRNEED